jgi:hypothetical protein
VIKEAGKVLKYKGLGIEIQRMGYVKKSKGGLRNSRANINHLKITQTIPG